MKSVTQKDIKPFREKMRNLFLQLTHPDCILRIKFFRVRAKIAKISSAIIYSATVYHRKNFSL